MICGRVGNSLGDVRKEKYELEERVSKLEEDVSQLELRLREQDQQNTSNSKLKKLQKSLNSANTKINNQKNEIVNLNNMNYDLKNAVSILHTTITQLQQTQVHQVEESKYSFSKWSSCTTKSFKNLFEEIEKIVVCPITMATMKTPVLAPSGNTLDKDAMVALIRDLKPDPFTRKGTCVEIKPNFLVKNLLEVYHRYEYIIESDIVLSLVDCM